MISPNYIMESGKAVEQPAGRSSGEKVVRKSLIQQELQIGAVSYLNSKPLVRGLVERELSINEDDADYKLELDYPSRLAEGLRQGKYDVALVPSIEYLLGQEEGLDYEIISNACVAARGPVLSVKVYFRVHPGSVKTMLLDDGSRTSAMLAKVLLAEKFGSLPECRQLSLDVSPWSQQADAMLVIGDRAMQSHDDEYAYVWDLGEEWINWTGYPFVFAMWVGRGECMMKESLAQILEKVRDDGIRNINKIVSEESPRLGISSQLAEVYLKKHLHFEMKSAERRGMALYFDLVRDYLKRVNN